MKRKTVRDQGVEYATAIRATDAAGRFTYQDYLRFPEDGKRYEIIEGELLMTPAPLTNHQHISVTLTFLLKTFLVENPIGELFHAPFDVVLSDFDVVQPDHIVVLNEQNHIVTDTSVRGAPDFVIEILSPSNRRLDLKRKRSLYEKFGVKEYWIIDPELKTIQKLLSRDGKFTEAGIFGIKGKISSNIVRGFQFLVSKLFV